MSSPGSRAAEGPPGRSAQLDVLRGIAICLVIGAHLPMAPFDGPVGAIGRFWRFHGGFGVPLFFALSGYLVGGLLLRELSETGRIDIARFLVRRGLKIYPAYFFFIAYLITMPLLKGALSAADTHNDFSHLWRLYLPNLLFINNYVGSNPAGHTWSLAVEEHFYLLLPLLLSIASAARLKPGWLALLMLAPIPFTALRLFCAYAGDVYIHSAPNAMAATHLWLDSLLVGVGVRALAEFNRSSFDSLHRLRWWALAAGCSILLVPLPSTQVYGVSIWRVLPLDALAATLLLVGSLHLRSADFVVGARLWRALGGQMGRCGVYSYGIYLWHVTIMGMVDGQVLNRLITGPQTEATWALRAIVICAAVIFGGIALSRLIEWPFLRLRERYFPPVASVDRRLAAQAPGEDDAAPGTSAPSPHSLMAREPGPG